MTSAVPEIPGHVLDDYRERLGQTRQGAFAPAVDELIGGKQRKGRDGGDHEALAATIDRMGVNGLQVARRDALRFVQDDGITYGATAEGFQGRNWNLDPLPVIIDADEWRRLEVGLRQRSELLNLILVDLYNDRRLLHSRTIPARAVLGHPGFIRQADGVNIAGRHQLILTASDLARDADGGWQVLSDRLQAPSGAGYAMANRRITSRVLAGLHRTTNLARLRSFFHTMSEALHAAAPGSSDQPRPVLLSPGPSSETAFDQAFTATLLGIPLVEADDLTSREGRIWLRSSDRLDPVDVIVRRVDADWCDQLELRPESRLGLPGLIDAARRQAVSVLNPLGAGVLENPALLPWLGEICRIVLGEELALPSAETWWCGDTVHRSHVLTHLEELAIKPVSRESERTTVLGWQLTRDERAELRARIRTEPWAWAAQDPVEMSTAPVISRGGLEPRRLVLRTFGVAHDDQYHFLPGGLARVAAHADQHLITNMRGALAKDVWVLSPTTPDLDEVSDRVRRSHRRLSMARIHTGMGLVPRVSDNLFWVGRYAERAEFTARLLSVTDDLVEDYGNRDGTPGHKAMEALLVAVDQVTIVPNAGDDPLVRLRRVMLDEPVPGTIAFSVSRLVLAAQQVRDQLSLDMWGVLSRLERNIEEIPRDEQQLQPQLAKLLESLLAVAGIMAEGMVRDASWAFIEAGGHIERALLTSSLLRATLVQERPPVIDGQVTEAVLQSGVSIITHRRRTASGTGPAAPVESATDLLLLDRINPRSVAYQLDRLVEDFGLIGDEELVSVPGALQARLRSADSEALCAGDRHELAALLSDVTSELRALAGMVTRRHFTRKPSQRVLVPTWETVGAP